MKKIELGEETREIQHPDDPDIVVSAWLPDRLHLAQMADRLADSEGAVPAAEAGEAVLGEIVRGVKGIQMTKGGKPHETTPQEWARTLFGLGLEFRRDDYIPVWKDQARDEEGKVVGAAVLKDPDTGQELVPGQYRTFTHPDNGRTDFYLCDEAGEAIKRPRRFNFGEYILDRVLRNTPGLDSGKGSPTLSAAQ